MSAMERHRDLILRVLRLEVENLRDNARDHERLASHSEGKAREIYMNDARESTTEADAIEQVITELERDARVGGAKS